MKKKNNEIILVLGADQFIFSMFRGVGILGVNMSEITYLQFITHIYLNRPMLRYELVAALCVGMPLLIIICLQLEVLFCLKITCQNVMM